MTLWGRETSRKKNKSYKNNFLNKHAKQWSNVVCLSSFYLHHQPHPLKNRRKERRSCNQKNKILIFFKSWFSNFGWLHNAVFIWGNKKKKGKSFPPVPRSQLSNAWWERGGSQSQRACVCVCVCEKGRNEWCKGKVTNVTQFHLEGECWRLNRAHRVNAGWKHHF